MAKFRSKPLNAASVSQKTLQSAGIKHLQGAAGMSQHHYGGWASEILHHQFGMVETC